MVGWGRTLPSTLSADKLTHPRLRVNPIFALLSTRFRLCGAGGPNSPPPTRTFPNTTRSTRSTEPAEYRRDQEPASRCRGLRRSLPRLLICLLIAALSDGLICALSDGLNFGCRARPRTPSLAARPRAETGRWREPERARTGLLPAAPACSRPPRPPRPPNRSHLADGRSDFPVWRRPTRGSETEPATDGRTLEWILRERTHPRGPAAGAERASAPDERTISPRFRAKNKKLSSASTAQFG
jgi:hypothetical protein